jgi:hypothetical protein
MKAAVRLLLQNCDLKWNFFEVWFPFSHAD